MSARAGTFIAFEGGDGAGKSTQVERLAQALREAGREVVVTRQPGGTPLGGQLRELLLHGGGVGPRAEALVFAADKAQHVDEVICPALERGAVVVTDRYTDSAIAYQGAGRELDVDEVTRLQHWAVAGVLPDLTVLIDVDPAEGRRRRPGEQDRLEAEADAFHTAVREHFLALAAAQPQRYLVVDAAQPPEAVATQVRDSLRKRGLL